MEYLLLAVLLGLIPAIVARSKGRGFVRWWFYGTVLFVVALPHALLVKPEIKVVERQQLAQGLKKCPLCAEMIKPDAKVCRYCRRDLPLPEPASERPPTAKPRGLGRIDKNGWPRRLCRSLASPQPLTYAEVVKKAEAGRYFSRGLVYQVLGFIDCGDPDAFVAMVKTANKSEADHERMQQLVSALMADYVFALKFDEIVFNPYTGGDAGKLSPIEHILNAFKKDLPTPSA